MPKEKSKLKTAEVAVSLEHLESPFPPLFPRDRLWLLEIGYFIGVAGAEEPKPLLSSSALPRGSFQLCPSKQSEFSAGKKAARRLLCCKDFALYNQLQGSSLGAETLVMFRYFLLSCDVSAGGYRHVVGTSTLDHGIKFKSSFRCWVRAAAWDGRGRIYSWMQQNLWE